MNAGTGLAAPGGTARRTVRVGDLVVRLQVGLQELFPNRFWLEGEISGFKVLRSGHAFFSLKDEKGQVEAVIWNGQRARLPFTPEDGNLVLALVRKVDFYGPHGRLRLQVDDIEPHGVGALARALEERRTRLRAEGLFDEERKRPIPALPRVIGIATAAGSAALHDILEILEQRFADRHMLIRPCRVQGRGAAEDIADALDDLNRQGSPDVIILGRGGGSMEDLWCFNEEAVVRAIARSRIPIVAGIGHEVDTTLADFAADLRVATPTAAAQRCVPDRDELAERLEGFGQRLDSSVRRRVELARTRLRACDVVLGDPRSVVVERRSRLAALAARARAALGELTPVRRGGLERAAGRLRLHLPQTDLRRRGLGMLGGRLEAAMAGRVQRARAQFDGRAGQIQALSPLAVLDRGFSLTRLGDGTIVRDARQVEIGDGIEVRLARGTARARVESREMADDAVRPSEKED